MSAQVTLVYRVNPIMKTAAQLSALMTSAVVPIPPELVAMIGGAIFSDVTAGATRTIVWTFGGSFKVQFPDTCDQRAPFWDLLTGAIRASVGYPVLADAPLLA